MADERFFNAIESITGIRDPFAPKPAPKQTPAKQVSAAPPAPSYEDLIAAPQRELAEAEKSYGEFQGMQAADEAEREALRMQRGSQALGTYRTALEAPEIREERAQLEEKISKPFVPTRDNFQDMATMYSLIGVLGFAIGAGGKGNAINAMSAMNGMMEGYRQGREDLYEKEKDAFEANTQALQTKINSLNNKMKEIADLAKVDYEKANLEADMLFAQEGADFLKQYKDKVGLVGTIKMLQEKVKGSEKLFEFMTKERDRYDEKERDRQFRAEQERQREQARSERQEDQQRFLALEHKRDRDLKMLVQNMIGARQREKQDTKLDKIPQKDRDAYQLRETTIPALESGLVTLDRLQKEGKWTKMTGLLAIDPRAAEAAFTDDPEALSLIRTFARFRSAEFETAGKALTKMEDKILSPLYRSDLRSYEATRNAMAEGLTEMKRQKQGLENQFPSLKRRAEGEVELPTPKTQKEFDALKKGEMYIDPDDGRVYRKK